MTARILVVDDLPTNRKLLELKLQAEYFEVGLAGSGAEALEVAERWSPDVILLDVMMPGLDGYEVCRRLKGSEDTAHIPVVMVTALVDRAERLRGLEAGADDFLSKPVDDATLFARLRALLRVKQVQDAWRLRVAASRELGLEPPPGPAALAGALALLVSADPLEAVCVGGALAGEGVVAELVGDLAAAEAACAGDGPLDLVLLSLFRQPGGGAAEDILRFASRLRAREATRDLPLLLIADAEQQALVLRGFDLGANDHVLRPVDPHELRARVRNQIRRKRYQDWMREDLDRSLALAVTDPLTGLRNRRYVLHHLDGLLRASDAAVLLLDVDRFKAINDGHGHAAGDAVLREVAARLRSHLRGADLIARYGGEEFLMATPAASPAYAAVVGERLRKAIGTEPFLLGGTAQAVSASVGIAVAPRGTPAERLIAAADAALYRAKSRGRNRCEMATDQDLAQADPRSIRDLAPDRRTATV